MTTIFKTSQAETDLLEIWLYIAQNNPLSADRLLETIAEKCHLIATFPEMGRERSELAVGLRSFPVENYIIFYRPIENGIEIIRVLHSSRDINTFF